MYNGINVSLKQVIWKVMNNPLASDLSYELAAEFAVETLRLIGAPFVLEDKTTDPPIKINNYKAEIPDDIITIKGIKGKVKDSHEYLAMLYATDTFHNNLCDREYDNHYPDRTSQTHKSELNCNYNDLSYTLNNRVIQTSFIEGDIIISYKCLPLDEEGFPLIPNNQKVLLALEYNILYRFLEPLWILGKISDKAFNHISQQKAWYVGAANTNMQLQSYDHIEAIMNSINRLIVNSDAHKKSFKDLAIKERLKRFN